MTSNIESQLVELNQTIKSLKSIYPVAGSLVPFKVSQSQIITGTVQPNSSAVIRLRFTPEPNHGGYTMVSLGAQSTGQKYPCSSHTEPQSGDGTAVLVITVAGAFNYATNYSVRGFAMGAVNGTFTRI